MKKAATLLLFVLLVSPALLGQDIEYARKVIKKLCSPKFGGRGYVKNGDGKAAKYIYNEFKKLKGVTTNYQPFVFPVNTFPNKMKLVVDNKTLVAGTDYLIDPESKGGKGTFGLLWATHSTFENEAEYNQLLKNHTANPSYFIAIDTLPATLSKEAKTRLKVLRTKPIKGIVQLSNKKLLWSVGSLQNPYIEILAAENRFARSTQNITIDIDAKLIDNYTANNVLGYIKGTQQPDSIVVLCAHYDHLGKMGKNTYFPGANDNASGTALMLDMARYYSQNPPKYSLLFIAFAAEEAGLVGSNYYVYANSVYALENMKFVINMDLMATGEKGMMAVNGLVHTKEFDFLVKLNEEKKYLSNIQARGKAANSDHHFFTEKGIPAFFFYLMGDYPSYHDPNDRYENIPLTEYEDTFSLLKDFIEYLQQ